MKPHALAPPYLSFFHCTHYTTLSASQATVVAVGPGLRNQEGKTIEPLVKVGHDVLLPEYGGVEVKLDSKAYFLYREDDILAILNNDKQ